jgi:hypothetical protein
MSRKYYLPDCEEPADARPFLDRWKLAEELGSNFPDHYWENIDHKTEVAIIEEDGSETRYIWESEAVVEHSLRRKVLP